MSTPTNRKEGSPAHSTTKDTPPEVAAPVAADATTKEVKAPSIEPTAAAPASAQLAAPLLSAYNQAAPHLNAAYNKLSPHLARLLQTVDTFLQKSPLLQQWKGRRNFLVAQGQILVVLVVAYIINNWPVSYPRNDNHSDFMFWTMTLACVGLAYVTLEHKAGTRGVQLLSRAQTEEWKGWMQFVFIMYHYYRNYSIYNEIRLLVSAYVWMTGFGHFLYCDKKQDFSIERMVSMWVRINYFPLLLSFFLGVPLELYYVVPLHTVGFFMAFGTCYLAKVLKEKVPQHCSDSFKANAAAIGISLLVHVVFFETSLHEMVLGAISKEYVFRFSTDKYSAWFGVLSGFFWSRFQAYMQWCYGEESNNDNDTPESPPASPQAKTSKLQQPKKQQAMQIQRGAGAALMLVWYFGFGSESDKHLYNPKHPFVFWMPVAGWLMLRNSSKYLTELHSTALEFLGRITLETYVLQFHVFMCRDVQHIPVIVPGSGADGFFVMKFANMLLTGVGFVALSWYARRATVTTQNAITELVTDVRKKHFGANESTEEGPMKTKPTLGIIEDQEEKTPLNSPTTAADKKDEES